MKNWKTPNEYMDVQDNKGRTTLMKATIDNDLDTNQIHFCQVNFD